MKYILWVDNDSVGPCDLPQIAQLYQQGVVTAETQAKSEAELAEWKSLLDVFPSLLSIIPAADQGRSLVTQRKLPSNKTYHVVLVFTGLFSGTLNPSKLQDTLNTQARAGWRFARSIQETRRILLFFRREAHFLIFERDS